MKRKGQFQIGFGMIFSIIIIIFIVGIVFYTISHFLGVQKCADLGLFHNDLEKSIDNVWRSSVARDSFSSSLPSGVEMVCFGSLDDSPRADSREQHEYFNRNRIFQSNMFIYPIQSECGDGLSMNNYNNIKAENDRFFCVEVVDRKVSFILEKRSGENKVIVSR